MIFNWSPLFGQCVMSIAKTRLSSLGLFGVPGSDATSATDRSGTTNSRQRMSLKGRSATFARLG